MKRALPLIALLALVGCMQPAEPWKVVALALSPDGGRVAVAWTGGENGGTGATALVYDLTDLDPVEIARFDGWRQVQSMAFSADGERLVVAAQEEKHRDLFLWEPGSPPAALTGDSVPEGDAILTPDGEAVVYRVKTGGAYRLALRRLDGTGRRVLTEDSIWRYRPTVLDDGGRTVILHQGQEGRRLHLAVIGLEAGAEPRAVLDGDGPEEGPVAREGAVLFRRGPTWMLCGSDLAEASCRAAGPPEGIRWSGSLALGPGAAPAGIVDRGGARGVARRIADSWHEDIREESGTDALMMATGGGVLAVAWQAPGRDAEVELGPWAGEALATLLSPVPAA